MNTLLRKINSIGLIICLIINQTGKAILTASFQFDKRPKEGHIFNKTSPYRKNYFFTSKIPEVENTSPFKSTPSTTTL